MCSCDHAIGTRKVRGYLPNRHQVAFHLLRPSVLANLIDQGSRYLLRDASVVLRVCDSRPGAVGGRRGKCRGPFERLLPELNLSFACHRPVADITVLQQGFWYTLERPGRGAWLSKKSKHVDHTAA